MTGLRLAGATVHDWKTAIFPFTIKAHGKPKSSSFRYDWELNLVLPVGEMHCFLRADGVRTRKKIAFRFWESFTRHLAQGHVPEKCVRPIKDLTDRIVKTDTYPAAHGGFSDVWSCRLLQYKQELPERVAVKTVRPVIANDKEYLVKQKAVRQELGVWAGLKHRNILPLYGITYGFGPFAAFVCPWADNGTLSQYLDKFESQLDLRKRMILLGDIAAGLQYLHSRDIIHGDLSGSNILITERGRAVLSDFGLSTFVEKVSDTVSGVTFSANIRWAAPELFDGCTEGTQAPQLLSLQADIYSFGSVMLQILTGKLPFHDVQRDAQIVVMIACGHQPHRGLGWDGRAIPDALWEFVETCWASPSNRPSSEEIIQFVGRQLSML